MFKDVKGIELTEEQMKSIEGEGWKNAVAFMTWGTFASGIGVLIGAIGWGWLPLDGFALGACISDKTFPIYRFLGFSKFDNATLYPNQNEW